MILKTLLAHVLVTYDLETAEEFGPRTRQVNSMIFTDPGAKIMFRKRMD